MLLSSAAIPPVAVFHRLKGEWAVRFAPGRTRRSDVGPPLAVLFDRDGTLITNVPYLADPDGVRADRRGPPCVALAPPARGAGGCGEQPVRGGSGSDQPRRASPGERPGRPSARAVRHLAGLPARRRRRLQLSQAGARDGRGRRPRTRRPTQPVCADRRHRSRRRRGPGRRCAGRPGSRRSYPAGRDRPRVGPGRRRAHPRRCRPAQPRRVGGDGPGARPARPGPDRPVGQPGRRAADRRGGACGGRQRRPGHHAGRPAAGRDGARCCPASTRCWSSRRRGWCWTRRRCRRPRWPRCCGGSVANVSISP